jgi:hypothetical protein
MWPKSSRLKTTHYEKLTSRGLTPIPALASSQRCQRQLQLARWDKGATLLDEREAQNRNCNWNSPTLVGFQFTLA